MQRPALNSTQRQLLIHRFPSLVFDALLVSLYTVPFGHVRKTKWSVTHVNTGVVDCGVSVDVCQLDSSPEYSTVDGTLAGLEVGKMCRYMEPNHVPCSPVVLLPSSALPSPFLRSLCSPSLSQRLPPQIKLWESRERCESSCSESGARHQTVFSAS